MLAAFIMMRYGNENFQENLHSFGIGFHLRGLQFGIWEFILKSNVMMSARARLVM